MRHRDLRTALAVEVIAAAMPEWSSITVLFRTDEEAHADYKELANVNTRRGAVLNTSLHALLTHDRYHPTNTLLHEPIPDQFTSIIDRAITLGESCRGTWDGVEYAWEHHADQLTRYIESVCTYRVPSPA